MRKFFIYGVLACSSFGLLNAADHDLPEPLSFNEALDYIKRVNHYSKQLSDANISSAQAKSSIIDSSNDIDVRLNGYLRQVGVSDLGNQNDNMDSKISLIAKKKLYDFGATDAKQKVANKALEIKKLEKLRSLENLELEVIKAYFDVLNADNTFLMNNENMSIAFIRFNRAQQNAEFGLSSDISILEAQTYYEKIRQQRYLSEANQRLTRQILAEKLGSTSLPDKLEVPKIVSNRRIIDNVDELLNLAFSNSLQIKIQNLKIALAQAEIKVADHYDNASLEAEFELTEYQRNSGFRDDWRASINFNVPIYTGDKRSSYELTSTSQLAGEIAALNKLKSLLRVEILSLWQTINQKTVELQGALIKQDFRDLYLERSRADYELEYQSDLGDAMVQFSISRAERFKIEFELEYAWRQLYKLIGEENKHKIVITENQPLNVQ